MEDFLITVVEEVILGLLVTEERLLGEVMDEILVLALTVGGGGEIVPDLLFVVVRLVVLVVFGPVNEVLLPILDFEVLVVVVVVVVVESFGLAVFGFVGAKA